MHVLVTVIPACTLRADTFGMAEDQLVAMAMNLVPQYGLESLTVMEVPAKHRSWRLVYGLLSR